MSGNDTKSWGFNLQTGVVITLLLGLLLVFIINYFSRKGIEGLIKSEEEVVNYFELTEKIKQIQFSFLEADIHFHQSLVFEKKENLHLVKNDLKNVKNLLADFGENENIFSNDINGELKNRIGIFKLKAKNLFDSYQIQFAKDTISESKYEKIELLRDSVELALDNLENYLQQIIISDLSEKRKFGDQVIFIDLVSFLFTVLIIIASIWMYINFAEQQKKLRLALENARFETEKTAILKEQFLTNTSHEIRTPLNAILGFAGLLQNGTMSLKQQELVSGIEHSGKSLLSVINDILDFSKLDAGMMTLQSVKFNPRDLVQSVVQMFQPQVAKKNIQLNLFLGKTLPNVVVGDPTRLTQVLVNLINNAIKFTLEGRVEIHAHFVRQEDKICRLGFRIMDTGMGISEKKQAAIFERFVQGNPELSREQGGTGLGLTIVKKIIDLQNGKIKFDSKLGEGSTFYFEIPYQYSSDTSIEKKKKTHLNVSSLPDGIRILVVEDNPMNRRVIELLFEDWKIDFDFAETGKAAIEKAAKQKYNLILMDIQLPIMDGYQVTRFLRKELHLETPIIAMTAHAIAGEHKKCVLAGMNDYIFKPFKEQDLIQLILKYTKGEIEKIESEPLLDMTYLNEMSRGKPERIKELANIFLSQAPKEILEIQTAIHYNDFTKIKSSAHSMKTTVGFMGLKNSLGKILNEMEEEAETIQRRKILEGQFIRLQKITKLALQEVQNLT